jgi:hypothetical protein
MVVKTAPLAACRLYPSGQGFRFVTGLSTDYHISEDRLAEVAAASKVGQLTPRQLSG